VEKWHGLQGSKDFLDQYRGLLFLPAWLELLEKEKKRKGKTTWAVKPLPTSIKEKETHWP